MNLQLYRETNSVLDFFCKFGKLFRAVTHEKTCEKVFINYVPPASIIQLILINKFAQKYGPEKLRISTLFTQC